MPLLTSPLNVTFIAFHDLGNVFALMKPRCFSALLARQRDRLERGEKERNGDADRGKRDKETQRNKNRSEREREKERNIDGPEKEKKRQTRGRERKEKNRQIYNSRRLASARVKDLFAPNSDILKVMTNTIDNARVT